MKNILVLLILIAVIVGGYVLFTKDNKQTTTVVTQTQVPTGWKIYTDSAKDFTFQYPASLDTKYMHPVSWPPTMTRELGTMVCKESGSVINEGGKTTLVTVGSEKYCENTLNEGAAGSTYTTYTYSWQQNTSDYLVLTFTIQATQCANYDEPSQSECVKERNNFDVLSLVSQIFSSVK